MYVMGRASLRATVASALLMASASPGAAFVISPLSRSHHALHAGGARSSASRASHMMVAHHRKQGAFRDFELAGGAARHFSGLPQHLGSVAAAIVSCTVSLPTRAAAAAESVAEVTKASITAASASEQAMIEIGLYFAKTVIGFGVPAVVIGLLIAKIISSARGPARDPLDDGAAAGGPAALFGKMMRKPGEPVEMLKIERLNERLDSFQYSLQKAHSGGRGALLEKRRKDFERAYGIAIGHLTDKQLALLLAGDSRFRARDDELLNQIDTSTRELRAMAASKPTPISDPEYKTGNDTEPDSKSASMMEMIGMGNREQKALQKKLSGLVEVRIQNELAYISGISALLGKNERQRLELLLRSRRSPAYADGATVLSLRPPMEAGSEKANADSKHVFVLSFPGDVTASQVAGLRQEITALSRFANASRGDEVVLLLNTGGGTVTGYGLAAAQLMRIKALGMRLHICVEQVAASGGYMMACCADRITASPFAVIGSIGVISELPNVYERLNREGVEFLTVTAGKYKRTLTPTKKPTDEDFKKTKADIEQVLVLFKDWVKTQRPALDIDKVATGETWFGPDALERNLVDELITSDDVLLQKLDEGAEIYSVKYEDPAKKSGVGGLLLPGGAGAGDVLASLAWQWVLSKAPQHLQGLQGLQAPGETGEEARFMALDPRRSEDTTRI